jgi:hypothetical protein
MRTAITRSRTICKSLLMLLTGFVFALQASAQCGTEDLLPPAAKKIKPGFNYLKDYKVDLVRQKKDKQAPTVRVSAILNAGQTYMLHVQSAPGSKGKLIAVLHNDAGAIASTFEIIEVPMHFESIQFDCKKTDIYYLTFSFEGDQGGCGIALLTVASESVQKRK